MFRSDATPWCRIKSTTWCRLPCPIQSLKGQASINNRFLSKSNASRRSGGKAFEVVDDGKSKTIRFRSGLFATLAAAGFISVWLTGWSVGCGFMIYNLITDFSVFFLMFSTPFFAAWFAAAAVLIWLLFGKEEIIIHSDSLEHRYLAGVVIRSKRVPFKEIRSIQANFHSGGEHQHWAAELETDGRPLCLATDGQRENIDELIQILTREIPSLDAPSNPAKEQPFSSSLEPRQNSPSDSRWDVEPVTGSEVAFVNQGRFSVGTVAALLFLNLFWNGIVSVFIAAPFQAGDDGMKLDDGGFGTTGLYLFLIPFILVGLVMLGALILAALDPFRKTMYAFSDREITRLISYFGIPWVRSWSVVQNVDMRLFQAPKKQDSPSKEETRFGIVFFEKDTKRLTWKKLSKGEADWIATTLQKNLDSYTVSANLPSKPKTPWD